MIHRTGVPMWFLLLAAILAAPGRSSGAPPSQARQIIRIGILANDQIQCRFSMGGRG